MADDCDVKVKEAFKDRDVSKSAMDAWLADAKALKDALDRELISRGDFNRRMNEIIADRARAAELQAMVSIRDKQIHKQAREFIDQEGFKGRESEAFRALVTKSVVMANESARSVDAVSRGMIQKYNDHIRTGLIKDNVMKLALSGQADIELGVARTIYALNMGKEIPLGVSPEAKAIGKTYFEASTMALMDIRDAGMPVQFLRNRVSYQAHDANMIRAAGFEKWSADVMELKPNMSFFGSEALSPKGLQKILRGIYDDILAGRYGGMDAIQDGELKSILTNGKISNTALRSRVLAFGPDESVKYMQTYGGKNMTIAQAVVSDISRKARQAALFERLGDAPRQRYETLLDQTIARLERTNPDAAMKLRGDRRNLMANFDQVAGANALPGSESLAKINQIAAPAEAVGKLGNLGLRALSNVAGGYADARTAAGVSLGDALAGIFTETAREIPEATRMQFSREAADFMQVVNGQIRQRILGDGVAGKLSKAAEFQLRINGHNIMNEAMGNAIAVLHQKAWAANAAKPFAEIPPAMQASMLQAGITKAEWPLFQHAVRKADNGTQIVSLEAFTRDAEFPPGVVEKAMKESGFKGTQDAYLRKTENSLRSFLIHRADVATTTAGPRESAALNLGTQTGTLEGEMVRLFMRFKSFTAQSINIMRTFANSTPNAELLAKGIVKSDPMSLSTLGMIGQYVVIATSIAYMADTAIRYAAGKKHQDPLDYRTWLNAMGKSGAGGLQVDLITGDWGKSRIGQEPRYNVLEALAGPTFGQLQNIGSAMTSAREGEFRNAGQDIKRTIRGYIPFQQMPGIKGGLDYVQRRTIDEMLNPGSSERRKLQEGR